MLLVFDSNTILLCFFLFFLIINLYFSIPAVVAQIFNPTVKLAIPIGIPTKEAKAEVETHQVITETKTTDILMSFKDVQFFVCFSAH